MADVWGIGDLHLSFGVPNKSMSLFGPAWENHIERLQKSWDELVSSDDLVLIPGDISWAMKLEEAKPDLQWIHERPGTKVIIKGNHDLWWDSISKVRKALPSSIHAIQNDTFQWESFSIAGARLWDTEEFSFEEVIEFRPRSSQTAMAEESSFFAPKSEEERATDRDIFRRELLRLEESLKKLGNKTNEKARRIAMTHYPPIGLRGEETQASKLLEQYGVDVVVFGHLHSLSRDKLSERSQELSLERELRGIQYHLTSCDWLNCIPKKIIST